MQRLLAENAANGIVVPGMEKGPCQDAWGKGLRHYVDGWWRTPDGWKFVTRFFPVFVKKNPDSKKSFNCDVKNEGGQYVLATLPGRDKLDVYLKSIPIYKDPSCNCDSCWCVLGPRSWRIEKVWKLVYV